MNVVENTIRVHEVNVELFEDKIAKANRRLERHGIDGRFVVALVDTHEIRNEDESVEFVYEYALNAPSFEYAGWEFLATTDILEGGTLLRIVPGKSMPEGYVRPEGHVCEHCNVDRPRTKSYLLREVATGEIKQVGSSCLALFLGVEPKGLWALGFVDELEEYSEPREGGPRAPLRWTIDTIVRMSYAVTDGGRKFVSKAVAADREDLSPSSDDVATVLTYEPRSRDSWELKAWIADMNAAFDAVSEEKVAEIIAFADTLSGDYGDNMRVLTGSTFVEYRHLGLLVSLVGVWYRAQEKEAQRKIEQANSLNEWVGKEKERLRKLRLTVKVNRQWDTDWGTNTMLVMVDEQGRTYKWTASKWIGYDAGDVLEVTGTVKKHETYQGTKQTVLTRCVIEEIEVDDDRDLGEVGGR